MNTSSNDTGSASFSLKWENPSNLNNMSLRDLSLPKGEAISELSYAPIDCTAIGVLTVTANVYDSNNTYLIDGGPWDCTAHSGTITNVPAGDNRKITVYGKDASNKIIYRGETTGVTITAGQITNAGSVTMSSIASDITAPTDGSLSTTGGDSHVSLSWSGFSDSGGIDYYKLVYSTSSTPSSCTGTQIYLGSGTSYTHTGLTNNTTYYYRICAIDNAGNTSNGATASGTPQSTGTATYTITITKSGSGSGTVTSSPSGINCGSTCTSSFGSGTSVALTATASSGSTFAGWSGGGCSGTGTCTITLSANTTVTATFNTSPAVTVTDIDGNIYNTVIIGTQVWMKENLKVTKYRNGDTIPTTTSSIPNDSSSKYQWVYNGNESNTATYGRLYTWYAVTDSRGVCPTGWHVPTDSEWTTLTDYLGGESVAGGKMKEAGTSHWSSPNTGADNSSGFTALPGGYRNFDGTFYSMGNYGYWWSATEGSAAGGWGSYLYFSSSNVGRNNYYKYYGFSIRCVRD